MSQDKAFDQYLQGQSELSRLYADSAEMKIPDHLDAAILAEAHRAVGSRPGGKGKHHWTFPLSMVATLFVVVMAGLMLPDMLKDASLNRQMQEQNDVASLPKQLLDAPVAAPAAEAFKPEKSLVVNKLAPAKTSSAPLQSKSDEMALQDAVASTEVAKPAPVATDSMLGAASPLPAAPPVAAVAAKPLPVMEEAKQSAAGYLAKEKKAAAEVEQSMRSKQERRAPAAVMMAEPAAMEPEVKSSLNADAADVELNPEAWIKRILQLQKEGKTDAVKKELDAFKKRYPEYKMPNALNKLN